MLDCKKRENGSFPRYTYRPEFRILKRISEMIIQHPGLQNKHAYVYFL